MGRKNEDWFSCPNCGTEVRMSARSCPECGADDETGWKDAYSSGQDVYGGEDDFDYDEFLENEFGEGNKVKVKPKGVQWWVWGLAVLLILSFLTFVLRWIF